MSKHELIHCVSGDSIYFDQPDLSRKSILHTPSIRNDSHAPKFNSKNSKFMDFLLCARAKFDNNIGVYFDNTTGKYVAQM